MISIYFIIKSNFIDNLSDIAPESIAFLFIKEATIKYKQVDYCAGIKYFCDLKNYGRLDQSVQEKLLSSVRSMHELREGVFGYIDAIRDPSFLTRVYNVLVHPYMMNVYVGVAVVFTLSSVIALMYYGSTAVIAKLIPQLSKEEAIKKSLRELNVDLENIHKNLDENILRFDSKLEHIGIRMGEIEKAAEPLSKISGAFHGEFVSMGYVQKLQENIEDQIFNNTEILRHHFTLQVADLGKKQDNLEKFVNVLGSEVEYTSKLYTDFVLLFVQKAGINKSVPTPKLDQILEALSRNQAYNDIPVEELLDLSMKIFFN